MTLHLCDPNHLQIQQYVYSDRVRPGTMAWLLSFEIINVFVGIGLAGLAIAQASQVPTDVPLGHVYVMSS